MVQFSKSYEGGIILEEKTLLEKVSNVGAVILVLGILSKLLSFVGLQFKALRFLGQYKSKVEIASIIIGLIIVLVCTAIKKKSE
jgi:hypothetical protein